MMERGMIQVVDHPERGPVEILGNPVKMEHSPTEFVPAPLLGQHTDEVLLQELGMTGGDVAQLRAKGVV
jgi:formyl-CoA transferase